MKGFKFLNHLISIDEKSGILRDITLISVDNVHLVNTTLENVDIEESGTPVFLLNGNAKNGLCDQVMEFYVYLSKNIMNNTHIPIRNPYES